MSKVPSSVGDPPVTSTRSRRPFHSAVAARDTAPKSPPGSSAARLAAAPAAETKLTPIRATTGRPAPAAPAKPTQAPHVVVAEPAHEVPGPTVPPSQVPAVVKGSENRAAKYRV